MSNDLISSLNNRVLLVRVSSCQLVLELFTDKLIMKYSATISEDSFRCLKSTQMLEYALR